MNNQRRIPWIYRIVVIFVSVLLLLMANHFVFDNCGTIVTDDVYYSDLPDDCNISNGNLVLIAGKPSKCNLITNITYDLRIIILTFKRPLSLLEILHSITSLELDGDKVLLEIWIDRSEHGELDGKTLSIARSFRWKHGPVHVYVQEKHAGIIGQWIYSWKPERKKHNLSLSSNDSDDYEIGLILEDDLTLSPYVYRWLKATRRHFKNQGNIAGITLQSEGLILASNGQSFDPDPLLTGPSFLYKLVGSWGFAPDPVNWLTFQNWFTNKKDSLRPYVPNIVMTKWYKSFEAIHSSHSMWTMWFIYFCDLNKLYTVYSNLLKNSQSYGTFTSPSIKSITNGSQGSKMANIIRRKATNRGCLVINRREPGLHYSGKAKVNISCINFDWKPEYVKFKDTQVAYDFKGKPLLMKNN